MKTTRIVALLCVLGVLAHAHVKISGVTSVNGQVGVNLAPGVSVVSLAISPTNQSVVMGTTVGYTATLTLSNLATLNVTRFAAWTFSDTTIADEDTLTQTMNALCITAGTVSITGTYGPFTASTNLTCTSNVPPAPTLVSIAVTPGSPSINVGASQGFTATGTYSDGSTQPLTASATWASSNTTNATLGTLGVTQPGICAHSGTSTISATDPATSISGSTVLTCNAVLTSINVGPASASILVGATQAYIATCNFNDGSSANCTAQSAWTSSAPTKATIPASTINSSNLATALAAGSTTITAAIGAVSGTSSLTVTNPGPPPPSLVSLAITPAAKTINVGSTLDLIATCTYTDGSTRNCSALDPLSGTATVWTSSNTAAVTLQLADAIAGTAYTKTLTGTGSTPRTWSVPAKTAPASSVDILDWWLMPRANRDSFHNGGGSNPRYSVLNAGMAMGIKSSGGMPQDGRWYDDNYLYFGTTDNGDSADQAACIAAGYPGGCFLDPFAYKLALNVRPFSPRYFVLGGPDVTINDPAPNLGYATTNCAANAHPPRDLGNVATVTHDAGTSTNWGGDVGNAQTIIVTYYRSLSTLTPPYQSGSRERYYMAAGFGVFNYDSADWNGTAYGPPFQFQNLNNLKVAGGPPTPNFACGIPTPPIQGLPPGILSTSSSAMTIGDTTGTISGTPNVPGTYPFIAQEEDGTGAFHLFPNVIRVNQTAATAQQTVNGLAAGVSTITATIGAISGNTTVTVQAPIPTLSSLAITPAGQSIPVGAVVSYTATGTYSDGSTKDITAAPTVWTSSNATIASIQSPGVPQPVKCNASGGPVTITATNGAVSNTTQLTCSTPPPPTSGMDAYCLAGNIPSFGVSDHTALLPTGCYYTNPSARPTSGTVRAVTQATWNSVWALTNCDDVVEIAAGTMFTGAMTIPSKVCSAGHYRTLRAQNFNSSFPAYGSRATPAYWGVNSLPGYPAWPAASNVGGTMQTTSQSQALILAGPISGLQIEGVHILRNSSVFFSDVITKTGTGFDHIILDRIWCSATVAGSTNRCFDSSTVSYDAAIDSFFSDFLCIAGGPSGLCSNDGQALSDGRNNTGVQDSVKKWVNNFAAASSETLFSGGGGGNIVPSDFEIRLNWLFKPMTWNPADPSYSFATIGQPLVKNGLEFKNGNRILIEGNICQNAWVGYDQNGSCVLMTPKSQSSPTPPFISQCPQCAVTNVTFRYNYITTANYPFQFAVVSSAAGFASASGSYSFWGNVADNLGYRTCFRCSGNSGNALDGGYYTAPNAPAGIVQKHGYFAHNTFVRAPNAVTKAGLLGISGAKSGSGLQMDDYTWTNNFAPNQRGGSTGVSNPLDQCAAGLNCNCGLTTPVASLNACFISYTFAGNCIVNDGGTVWPGTNVTSNTATESSELVNYNSGLMLPGGDFRLKPGSACHNQATDGFDPGADINTLLNRIAGVNSF